MTPRLSLLITVTLLLVAVSSRAPVEEGPRDKYCGTFLWARLRGLKDQCAKLREEYEPLPQERRRGGIVKQCCDLRCSQRTLVDFACHDATLDKWFQAFDE
ncbi:hypothetical protein PRIPAC_96508 [Pristionchus pacificus]|uniref:Uncharacterized protein n=1 Tax=Pristionchus pacificus TaxID=54126 RepID=A0A454Y5K4_PRIPA|nr:hypothetical protein PRIPAC_96508 [Pristionchus pacificus]|eukprot:PDM84273.1 hypothetical protein PRIPAC_33296 [Pristionchus pacificus]